MNCGICKKEVFSTESGQQPQAFMTVKPEHKDDVKCEEHKNK